MSSVDLPNLRIFFRQKKTALAGFMELGAGLELSGDLLRVVPHSDTFVRYLTDNKGAISALASEFFGRPVEAEVTAPAADDSPARQASPAANGIDAPPVERPSINNGPGPKPDTSVSPNGTPPSWLSLNVEGVPAELRELKQWVVTTPTWREGSRGKTGKWTKPPLQVNGRAARSNDPETWTTFIIAQAHVLAHPGFALGFVFSERDDYYGIDLDHCRDPKTGVITPWAAEIIRDLNSYAESSLSATGVHVIGKGKLPADCWKKRVLPDFGKDAAIEVYDQLRFFAFTGHVLEALPIEERQEEIDSLLTRFAPPSLKPDKFDRSPTETITITRSDAEVLDQARRVPKFASLYAGDLSGYGNDASSGDLALCGMLAFYSGGNAAQIDRLFRGSRLMRGKWDEKHGKRTYGAMTVAKALEGRSEFYDWGRHAHSLRKSNPAPAGASHVGQEKLLEIDIAGARLWHLSDLAIASMREANSSSKRFFQRGNALTRLSLAVADGKVSVEALETDSLRGEMDRCANWSVTTKEGGKKVVDAPLKVARDVLALKQYKVSDFPSLEAVAHAPFFDADYNLVATSGYHETSQVYLQLAKGLEIPDVAVNPNPDEVAHAKKLLFEMIQDFPFVGDADRAHALAALLYPYVRKPINAPPPGALIDAASPGSGKGMLVSAIVRVNTGSPVETIPAIDRDDAETRKRITALLLNGANYAAVDNVAGIIRDSSLASLLTAEIWKDRVLGSSRMVVLDNRTQWFFTGNNIRCTTEMARRFIRSRLEANVEHPEERADFLHDPLLDWVRDQRGLLIWAILTLVQNWIAKGRQEFTKRRLGSFERWGRIIGGILDAAGIPGFLDEREQMVKEVDEGRAEWSAFVKAWFEHHGAEPVRVADLLPLIDGCLDSEFTRVADTDRARETRLGNLLRARRGTVIADHKVVPAEVVDQKSRKKTGWCLEDRKEPPRNSQLPPSEVGEGRGLSENPLNIRGILSPTSPEVGDEVGDLEKPLQNKENSASNREFLSPTSPEVGDFLARGRGQEKPLQNKENSASNSLSPTFPYLKSPISGNCEASQKRDDDDDEGEDL